VNRPWVEHYDPGVESTLDYPKISLPELLDRTVERQSERVATIFMGGRLRYRQIKDQADRVAAGLQQLGIQPGDRVALMLPNVPQFVVTFYGILRAGATVVPTNPLYTRSELAHQLADAGAVAVVTMDQLFPTLQEAIAETEVRSIIVAGLSQVLPFYLRPGYALKQWRAGKTEVKRGGIVTRFEDLLSARPSATPQIDPNGIAVLQYTGGTTGESKGAMLSHRNLLVNAIQAYNWQGSPDADQATILCAAPFFHVYGLTVGMNLAIVAGATMLLVPRFIPAEVARVAEKYKPQLFPGVPTMYIALANQPGFSAKQFGSLHTCISGAAALPLEVQRRFREVSDVTIAEGYGLTEASPVTHCNPIATGLRPGTVGVPFPDTNAMITDPETWEPLPAGTLGEITVSGPQVMQGYWNRPEETAVVLRNGWLHTGDLGMVDEDGYFTIVDRKKDMIDASGFKVYPREVEDVLYAHPAIKEAAVVGVPHPYRGETVKAVIVLKGDAEATEEEICSFCRDELAIYKVPKVVEFRTELPKSLVGKVLRRVLRAEHIEGLGEAMGVTTDTLIPSPSPAEQESPLGRSIDGNAR
jgi:long-chain acyl-CoA synthetase